MAAGNSKITNGDFTKAQRERLGKLIRAFRKQAGYSSAEDFANAHNIHRVQMGRYEKGDNLTFSSLVIVIRELGITPKEFFDQWSEW